MKRVKKIRVPLTNGGYITAEVNFNIKDLTRSETEELVDEMTEDVANILRGPRYHARTPIQNVSFR